MSPSESLSSKEKLVVYSGEKNWNRTLLFFGIFLVVVILAEVFYYVYLQSRPKQTRVVLEEGQRPIPTITPTTRVRPKTIAVGSAIVDVEKLRSWADIMDRFPPSGFLANSFITTTFVGRLVEIVNETTEVDGVVYSLKLRIENEEGKVIAILFTENEVKRVQITLVDPVSSSQASFDKLKKGDKLIIILVDNLLDKRKELERITIEARRGIPG